MAEKIKKEDDPIKCGCFIGDLSEYADAKEKNVEKPKKISKERKKRQSSEKKNEV